MIPYIPIVTEEGRTPKFISTEDLEKYPQDFNWILSYYKSLTFWTRAGWRSGGIFGTKEQALRKALSDHNLNSIFNSKRAYIELKVRRVGSYQSRIMLEIRSGEALMRAVEEREDSFLEKDSSLIERVKERRYRDSRYQDRRG